MELWEFPQSTAFVGGSFGPCCLSLLEALGSRVVAVPGSAEYSRSLSTYYAQQEAEIQPLCIVQPDTTDDVASTVKIISATADTLPEGDAQALQCRFAIRSGGHGINAGQANIAGGVTIDLSRLNGIEVSDDAEGTAGSQERIASVGPGATWGEVYAALEPLGLSVAGARNTGPGVGGLTTGGGISFFSPRRGWTCDDAVGFEVVLANGTVAVARAGGRGDSENPDLLTALRGGGSSGNFGVVTRIDLRAFEQGPLWGGLRYHDLDTIDDHLRAFTDFAAADPFDEYASLITTYVLFAGRPPIIATSVVYTRAEENPPSLRAITSIPATSSTLRTARMTELAAELSSLQPYGFRQLYVELTHTPTLPMLNATYRRWSESLASVRDVPGVAWCMTLEPLPEAIYNNRRPSTSTANSLGLTDRDRPPGPLVVALLTATWADAADDGRMRAAARGLMGRLEGDARRLRAHDPFVYLNYAADWQDPIASYGRESVERLRRVQRDVDPRGFLARNAPGGFKIPVSVPASGVGERERERGE